MLSMKSVKNLLDSFIWDFLNIEKRLDSFLRG